MKAAVGSVRPRGRARRSGGDGARCRVLMARWGRGRSSRRRRLVAIRRGRIARPSSVAEAGEAAGLPQTQRQWWEDLSELVIAFRGTGLRWVFLVFAVRMSIASSVIMILLQDEVDVRSWLPFTSGLQLLGMPLRVSSRSPDVSTATWSTSLHLNYPPKAATIRATSLMISLPPATLSGLCNATNPRHLPFPHLVFDLLSSALPDSLLAVLFCEFSFVRYFLYRSRASFRGSRT